MERVWIFLFACLSFFSLAAEEDNSEGDPFSSPQTQLHNALPLLVNDSVSVISGEWLLSETDFVVPGPDSLVLTRHYSTGHLDKMMGHNWEFNRPGYLDIDRDADNYINGGRTRKVRFNQPSGLKTLHQAHKDAKENLLSFELMRSPGLTNCRSHEISARTNLHNIEVHLDSGTAHAVAMTGSGHLFYFQDRGKETEDRIFLHRRLKPLFERKPNGHFVIFHKNEVHALNPTQQLDYSHLIWDSHGPEELEVKASDGRSAIYKFVCYEHGQKEPEDPEEMDRQLNSPIEPKKPKTKRYYLSEVNCSHKPKETYEYSHLSFEEPTERPARLRLTCKRLPNDRFIKTKYDSQGRVKQQLAPVGTDQTPIVTHRFVYSFGAPKDSNRSDSPRSGTTEVFDALGRKTAYEYNTDQRLTQVTKYVGNKAYVSEHYLWDDEHTYLSSPLLQMIQIPLWDWLFPKMTIPTPDESLLDRGQTPPPPSFVELAQEAHQESGASQDGLKVPLTRGHSRPPKVIEDMQQEQVNFPLQAKADFLTLFEACLKGHRIQKSGKGNLMGKYVQDAAGHMESLLCFDYDDKGNVLAEFVYGNLTGQCQEKLESHSRWDVFNKRVECYAKRFAYTNDHLNLVIAELEDNGKGMLHGYVPGTNLVSAKYVMDHGRIVLRQFYDYDENTTLVKLIKDDGSDFYRYDLKDVHERHVTYFYPRQTAPFGLPERIDEMYWDLNSNQEKLLKRIICHYSAQGKLIQQDHYDSNEMYCYSLFWEYDAHGNVIREVNALGQVITKQYDENDNLIFEQGPSLDFFTTYVYDYANRLIASKEDHGGKILTTSHRYDYVGNRVAAIDPFGQETQYVYDDLNRLVKTIHPPVLNEAGHAIQPTVSTDYDFMGRPVTVTDARGNQTRTTYNARGKPTSILHADGTLEELIYALDGSLAASIAPNKTKTTYQRDCLGRVLKEEIWQGSVLLSCKTYAYKGLRLIKETDAEGIETSYEYDGAGRLIKETCGRACKDMEYDSLNRLAKVTSWFGDDPASVSIKCMSYDLLGRLLEEKTVDAFGQILEQSAYIYDCLGNRTHAIQQTQAGLSINQVEYDSQSRPIKMIDAEGHATHIVYDESFYNALGQQVLRVETTDPQGKITEKIFDALSRESVLLRKDSFGNLLAKQERYYDTCGNLCKTVDAVMVDGIQQSESINSWMYNEMGQETCCVEGVGTPEQKHTYTDYNADGQKSKTTKPDGTALLYTYDAHGRLSEFKSGDGSLSYRYAYNCNHQVTQVDDLVHHTRTTRLYDGQGNLASESLANGLSVSYAYDRLGRPVCIQLPDGSAIGYRYDAAFLREVSRIKSDQLLYSHCYEAYDQAGLLLSASLIGKAGQASYQYDLSKRQRTIQAPSWSEVIPEKGYDESGRLILKQIEDVKGSQAYAFGYNNLDHLQTERGHQAHYYQTDSLQNRLSKDGQAHTLNGIHQLLKQKDSTYVYDRNGNLIEKTQGGKVTRYRYDALSRLIQVITDQETISYAYDPFNRRMSKTRSGLQERYLYQGENEIGSVDNKGAIQELRLLGSGHGAELGAAIALELKGHLFAPLHDHQGHVVCLLDAQTGQACEAYRYTAFGEETILNATGQEIAASQIGNPWRYASKRVDPETGWIYFGRRYYDPEIGRWTTPDPLGFADGPNLYAYLHHNPLIAFDAYGLFEEDYQGDPANHPIYDQDLGSSNTNYNDGKISAICIGMAHGATDFIVEPIFETYSDCFTVGIESFEELSLEEKEQIYQAHTLTVDAQLDYYEKLLQSAPGSSYTKHPYYQVSRSLTKMALNIATTAYAGYKIVTSCFNALKLATQKSYSFSSLTNRSFKELKKYESQTAKKISDFTNEFFFPNPLKDTCYTEKVLRQMMPNSQTGRPDFHGFPLIVDNYAKYGRQELITGRDGIKRIKIILSGGYQDRTGHFEWIIESNNTINHRLFIENR